MGAGLSGKLDIASERALIVWIGLLSMGGLVSVVLYFLHRSNRKYITLAENCEIEMIRWLEEHGFDVKTNIPLKRAKFMVFPQNWLWQSLIIGIRNSVCGCTDLMPNTSLECDRPKRLRASSGASALRCA